MRFQEYGNRENPTLVMLQPMLMNPSAFNFVIPQCSKNYHVVVPTMPGHDPQEPNEQYTSIEEIASCIEKWVQEHCGGHVKCIYGCSMGGAVTIRLLSDRNITADTYVIDGGITPYQLWKPLRYLICLRDFMMIWLVKHMSVKVLRKMMNSNKYSEKDVIYVRDCLHGLHNRTIWRGFYSTNNYDVALPLLKPVGKVFYWYGAEERKDRSCDLAYIRKNLPWAKIQENIGMGHAESFTVYPEIFCKMLAKNIC